MILKKCFQEGKDRLLDPGHHDQLLTTMANEPWNETEEELRNRGYEKTDDGRYVNKYGEEAKAEGAYFKEEKDPAIAPWEDVRNKEN